MKCVRVNLALHVTLFEGKIWVPRFWDHKWPFQGFFISKSQLLNYEYSHSGDGTGAPRQKSKVNVMVKIIDVLLISLKFTISCALYRIK